MKSAPTPNSVDEYIRVCSPKVQSILQKIRSIERQWTAPLCHR